MLPAWTYQLKPLSRQGCFSLDPPTWPQGYLWIPTEKPSRRCLPKTIGLTTMSILSDLEYTILLLLCTLTLTFGPQIAQSRSCLYVFKVGTSYIPYLQPATLNCPSRNPKYHRIETFRALIGGSPVIDFRPPKVSIIHRLGALLLILA